MNTNVFLYFYYSLPLEFNLQEQLSITSKSLTTCKNRNWRTTSKTKRTKKKPLKISLEILIQESKKGRF